VPLALLTGRTLVRPTPRPWELAGHPPSHSTHGSKRRRRPPGALSRLVPAGHPWTPRRSRGSPADRCKMPWQFSNLPLEELGLRHPNFRVEQAVAAMPWGTSKTDLGNWLGYQESCLAVSPPSAQCSIGCCIRLMCSSAVRSTVWLVSNLNRGAWLRHMPRIFWLACWSWPCYGERLA
jgi:hypothetical protein